MSVLVTGAAGFVGFHVANALLARGERVIGVDNLNSYYNPALKSDRLALLNSQPDFKFFQFDIAQRSGLESIAAEHPEIDRIVHLAAQAGVRHSMVDPHAYVASNVLGHLNILEMARRLPTMKHLVYASSSSVYGANQSLPFSEGDRTDTPLSLYAATKRADELMSYSYGHLFRIPQTGLRFFTVYGPWGRPDMAYFLFAESIMSGKAITVYDQGNLRRDFTYIDDIVEGVVGSLDQPPVAGDGDQPPNRILNIGNHRSERVATLIDLLELSLGRRALRENIARPRADVLETCASVDEITRLTGFSPSTPLATGIPMFASWFLEWRARGKRTFVDFGVDPVIELP